MKITDFFSYSNDDGSVRMYEQDELLLYLIEFVEDIKTEKRIIGILKGKRVGRPPKLTKQQVLKAIKLKEQQTSNQVASRFNVGRSTLYRYIAKVKEAS